MKDSLLNERDYNLIKGPNAVMNDYTKNISQSIFTPGVYKVDGKIETLQKNFAGRRGYDPHGQDTIPTGTYKRLYIKDEDGMAGTVSGRLGEKYMKRGKEARVRSAAPTQSRAIRSYKASQSGKKLEDDQGSNVSGMKVYYDQHRLKEMARQNAVNKIDMEVSRMKTGSRKLLTKATKQKNDSLSRTSGTSNARRLQTAIDLEKTRRKKLEDDVQSVRSVLES